MPVNEHLRPIEIRDFAPGLWERNDWLMPASAAQVMENCYPQEGGGLRAFFKPTAISVSGIADISEERVIGLHARGGIPARSGSPTDLTDRYLLTYAYDGSDGTPKLYRMDGSNSETTWTQIFATSGTTEFDSTANNAPGKASFRFFKLSSGSPDDQYVLLVLRYTGDDATLWRLNYDDLSSAQKAVKITPSVTGVTLMSGPISIHQARVMIFAANSERLCWSNPGTVTFDAANFLDVEPNRDLPNPIAMQAIEPSDLLVWKEGGPAVVIQGDITSPTVQAMSEGIAGVATQDFGVLPNGMVSFIAKDGFVYMTDGRTMDNISAQLRGFLGPAGNDYVGMPDTAYIDDFLFVGSGKVYHLPTKSWFTQTQLAGNVLNVERYTGQIWGPVGSGEDFTINTLTPSNRGTRLSTFHWKSAPLRGDDGRQVEIREVEVTCKSFVGSSTIAVTVGGQTVTKTLSTSNNPQVLDFLFAKRGEVMDVDIVSTAGIAGQEAPSIESVRIYTRPGHHRH